MKMFWLFNSVFYFVIFAYDLNTDRDIWTWILLLVSIGWVIVFIKFLYHR